jgi:hypothetical protein
MHHVFAMMQSLHCYSAVSGTLDAAQSLNHCWWLEYATAASCCAVHMYSQFKSTAEAFAKAPANLNDHYTRVANTSDAKKHLTMLVDTLVWQYLPDMVQLLQEKGIHYKLPEVPMLVARG